MSTKLHYAEQAQPIAQDSSVLRFLYGCAPGRFCLRLMCARWVSRACGRFLDSRLSRRLIGSFVQKNRIDLADYYADDFTCFNDCFTRRIREEKRPIDDAPDAFVSPCDGLLSAYRLQKGSVIPAKQSRYTVADLLQNSELAKRYEDGICLVFRLCVNHYHRYCYVDDGTKEDNHFISGKLHTVRPIALRTYPVFCENCREYTVMHTDHFGDVTQIEVGAMLVGKIANLHGAGTIRRGAEKGMFLYGGSTIIVLLEKGRVDIPQACFAATENGMEIPVQMGQRLN